MSVVADEAGEKVNRIMIQIAQWGSKVVLNLGKKATLTTLKGGLHATEKALAKVPGLPGAPEHGKMSVKQLQHKSQDGLRAVQLSAELVKNITHDLKKRGVDFAVEKAKDGNTYVHIKAKDVDTMQHAISQVNAKLAKPKTREELKEKIQAKTQEKKAAKQKAPKQTETRTPKAPKMPSPKGVR